MNVAIVGFGVEGKAALTYWEKLGAIVTVCDQEQSIRSEIPEGITSQLGPNYVKNLGNFDVIVRSAGVNPKLITAKNPAIKNKLTTVINEFLRVSPTKHIIGVTGTKGKGTTTTLITDILKAAHKSVFLGGNIGTPPLEFLPNLTEDSWVVLELSSFQLSDLRYSPAIAVCLMVVPEHLNWHADMEDYVNAKAHLFEHQSTGDIAIYYSQNDASKQIASHSPGHQIPYFTKPGAYVENGQIIIDSQTICATSELKLLGEHNWQNVCAAVTAVWQVVQDVSAIRSVLTTFTGLPHRLEFVGETWGIRYYNDSFAATPDAAIAALDAIPGPKVMIMGGFDRQLPIDHLARALKSHQDQLKKVILIGASAKRLAGECDKVEFTNYQIDSSKSLSEIVTTARTFAIPGDALVLSPGFASFDMFKNFEERGLQFKAAVEQL
jgi:UDP-N-acetylmuramoylalanine--D-glutamate ligase